MAIVDSPALRTNIISFIAETVRGKDVLDGRCVSLHRKTKACMEGNAGLG
jgi:hypothetical protein